MDLFFEPEMMRRNARNGEKLLPVPVCFLVKQVENSSATIIGISVTKLESIW